MSNEKKMRILKTGECQSLSGKSTLTYNIGANGENDIYVALTGNSGAGIFNKDWFALEEIYSLLASQEKVTSGSLHGLFERRSSNSAGFILAVLLKEQVLKISQGNKHYNIIGQAEFGKTVQALLDSGDSSATKKRSGKKGKGGSND